MLAQFETAKTELWRKGPLMEKLQAIAQQTLWNTLDNAHRVMEVTHRDYQAKLDERNAALGEAQDIHQKTTEQLITKHKAALEKSNDARKQAAARANRYKKQYDNLLDDIDAALPGAKDLLKARAISEAEKRHQLDVLTKKIEVQESHVADKVVYSRGRYRDTFLPGYGKERRILQSLLERKKQLEKQKSY